MFSYSCVPLKEGWFIVESIHWLFRVVQSLGPVLFPGREADSLHRFPVHRGVLQEWRARLLGKAWCADMVAWACREGQWEVVCNQTSCTDELMKEWFFAIDIKENMERGARWVKCLWGSPSVWRTLKVAVMAGQDFKDISLCFLCFIKRRVKIWNIFIYFCLTISLIMIPYLKGSTVNLYYFQVKSSY